MELEDKNIEITVGIHQDFRRNVVVAIRKYKDDTPTNEGIVLTLSEWEGLKENINTVDKEIHNVLKKNRPVYQRQNANLASQEEFDVEKVVNELYKNMTDVPVEVTIHEDQTEPWYCDGQSDQNDKSLNWWCQYWNEQINVETVDTSVIFNTDDLMDFENLSTITLFDEDSVYEACMEEDGIISDDLMNFENLSTITLFDEDSVYDAWEEQSNLISDSLFSEDIFNEAWDEQLNLMISDYIHFDTNANFPWEDCMDNKVGEKKE